MGNQCTTLRGKAGVRVAPVELVAHSGSLLKIEAPLPLASPPPLPPPLVAHTSTSAHTKTVELVVTGLAHEVEEEAAAVRGVSPCAEGGGGQEGGGWREIHFAVRHGRVDRVRHLVTERGVDVNTAALGGGCSPLHVAAWHNQLDVAACLLALGADVGALDNAGCTPIHTAADGGHADMLRLLLQAGPPASPAPIGGNNRRAARRSDISPLHMAAQRGHAPAVTTLLAHGAQVQACAALTGRTPLHVAALSGHTHIVRLLLEDERGEAVVEAKDLRGCTALHLGVASHHVGVIQALLAHGANVCAASTGGSTPLHLACEQADDAPLRMLLDSLPARERSAACNVRDARQRRPLHRAAEYGHLPSVHLLLSVSPAAAATADNAGWLPMHLAVYGGHDAVVRALLECGTPVAATNYFGWTALHCAASANRAATACLLLAAGANVDAATVQAACTPLHVAVYMRHAEVARALVEAGASPHIALTQSWQRAQPGATALSIARQHADASVLNLLLSCKSRATEEPPSGIWDSVSVSPMAAATPRADVRRAAASLDVDRAPSTTPPPTVLEPVRAGGANPATAFTALRRGVHV